MGRRKVKMEIITNEKSRRKTFNKRSTGLMKKCYEVSTLCDVDVCMVASGPSKLYTTYPQKHEEVDRIIQRYLAASKYNPPKTSDLSDFYVDDDQQDTKTNQSDPQAAATAKYNYPVSDELIDQYCPSGDYNRFIKELDDKLRVVEEMIHVNEQNDQVQVHINADDDHDLNFDLQGRGQRYSIPLNKLDGHDQVKAHVEKLDHHDLGLDHHGYYRVPLDNNNTLSFQAPQFGSSPMTSSINRMGIIMTKNEYDQVQCKNCTRASSSSSTCSYIDQHHHHHHQNNCINSVSRGVPVCYDPTVVGVPADNFMVFRNNINGNSHMRMMRQHSQLHNPGSSIMMRQYSQSQPVPPPQIMEPYMHHASMPLQWPGETPSHNQLQMHIDDYDDHQQKIHGNDNHQQQLHGSDLS